MKIRRNILLRFAAVFMGMAMAFHIPQMVFAAETPFPIAWQQSEEAGADLQREAYLPQEASWCNYPWNRGSETDNTIGLAGCSMLSVVNSVYHKTGQFLNPTILADFTLENGYRIPGVAGATLDFFPAFAGTYGDTYSVSFVQGTSNASTVLEHIRSGGTSCSNIYGHWIAIVEYDAETDRYLILDSSQTSQRVSSITWTDKENGIAWLTPEELLAEGKSGTYGIGKRYSALFTFDYTFTADTGDADGNGTVDVSDACTVLTHCASNAVGKEPPAMHPHPSQNDACLRAADVNADGSIMIEDAISLLNYYAKRSAGLDASWKDTLSDETQ